MKILIIEDEQELLYEIKSYLEKEDFICEVADMYNTASEKLSVYHYDIVLVDIMLPGGTGLDLIKTLKNIQQDTGILIISAKNSLDDKLYGLDLGADDYITKPFHLAELNSRIKSVLRRRKFNGAVEIVHNEIKINPDNKAVYVKGKKIALTKKEYELLNFFIANKNRMLTKESIAEHLWGDNIDLADNFDFIYTHINNLRKKIASAGGSDYLLTVYGMGYKYID
jgi:DNA-binding response OmpR family regulator